MDRQSQQLHRGRSVTATSAAQANEYFEHFLNASTMKTILGYSRSICELLHLRPNQFPHFYPKLRANLTSWRAKALWKKFDMRASHKCYAKGKACPNTRVLIIGAGPCGLRAAIEAQLLGAKVVVVEKRDRMSRNNVLHLWPFVIEDLRMLGAKKFFGKFCAGAIDHISIRQLQCILLKVALLLGVEIHTEVSFEKLVEPNSVKNAGWRAEVNPPNHPVSQYEFDVIIGADGKRNTLQGFKRKEFRGKLAIAITANFINKRTEAEARVEEISGVAFIFNQKFFKDLFAETGIDLENIVYYKDDTHYFVMTAKKASLIEKGVIKRDLTDTEQLLAPDNVDREALMNYAREAADFSTNYQMPNLEFAVNHYGQPDVAMFDFTSMYAAENASKVLDRNGHRLLMILVGDSLLEPFWPTGSGCARGFLSSLDAAWAIRSWGSDTVGPLEVMAERESIYRLLAQTTPDNLNKEWKAYTLDPATRYPNLNKNVVLPHQVLSLFDTDNPKSIEAMKRASTDIAAPVASAKRRKRDTIDKEELVEWIKEQVKGYDGLEVTDVASIFRDGRILCAVIHHYRPDLLDYSSLSATEHVKNNQIAIDVLEKELGVSPLMTATEMTTTEDFLTVTLYLTEVYHTFKCDIPHIDHPKIDRVDPVSPESHSQSFLRQTDDGRTELCTNINQKEKKVSFATNFSTDTLKDNLILTPIQSCEDTTEEPKEYKKIYSASTDCEYLMEFAPDFVSNNYSTTTISDGEATTTTTTNNTNQEQLSTIKIRLIEVTSNQIRTIHYLKYNETTNTLTVIPKSSSQKSLPQMQRKYQATSRPSTPNIKSTCHVSDVIALKANADRLKFLFTMVDSKSPRDGKQFPFECTYERVIDWLTSCDFQKGPTEAAEAEAVVETNIVEGHSDITSVTKCLENQEKSKVYGKIKVDDRTRLVRVGGEEELEGIRDGFVVGEGEKTPPVKHTWQMYEEKFKGASKPPNFSVILEAEESELPESKRSVTVHNSKCNVPSAFGKKPTPSSTVLTPTGHVHQVSRPSSRHKRHIVDATAVGPLKPLNALERKPRKRRTAEKIGASVEERQKRLEEIVANRADRQSKRRQQRKLQTEQFIKSMQMLEANSRSDSGPFEDYSIFLYRQTAPNFEDRVKDLEKKFTYVPDHENTRQLGQSRAGEKDEDFAARIKNLEDKWSEPVPTEKKPRDLLRAIGKIETSDWNIKEIEKKINENKMGKTVNRDKEKVPKWSREQFLARQTKMEKQHLDRQDSKEAKFADIDKNIRELDLKLKEGNARELGQNKVASITEKFVKSSATEVEAKPVQRSNSKVIMPTQGSEFCHFCQKRVYLMERLSAEGRFFHHGCFKCQYCHTQLRLGSYAFDKDGLYGHKFYCIQHYGMQGELPTTKLSRKPSNRIARDQRSPEKKLLKGVDLLDRVQTPERVEFAGHISSEHDEPLSQMDEDEWTDRNFGASTAEIGSSDDDDSSSSLSDTESDPEDAYEEALEEPITKEGTMKWAERLSKRYARKRNDSDSEDYSSSDQSSYYENTSGDDDSETATEDEEEIKAARELRKQEVRVKPPVIQTDTGTDTEIVSDESSSTSSEPQNSATEISTDSEFAQDDPTPTREVPSIVFNDFFVTKTRGSGRNVVPKKIQITSGYVRPANGSVQLKKEQQQQQQQQNEDVELKLAPLVAPSTLVLKRSGEGYALNRTQSTGGIAAKVSLELKKKYLLGEGGGGAVGGLGSGIQKSGSASTLDFKFKSFHTNITDCQKLLKPALEALNPPETRKVEQQAPAPAQEPFENVNEGRPRSPVHETSIIVPEIDWGKQKQQQESDFNDSLSSDSDKESPNLPIPRVEVHEVTDDLPLDSLCIEPEIKPEVKSITSEKKELNQPKTLPGFNVSTSGRSTPSNNDSIADQITAALTETELSDWARDGAVSDEEFDDVFDVKSDEKKKPVKAIRLAELEIDHICGKDKNTKEIENMLAVNNALSTNLDNIEFMDTGSESSTGDELFGELNGYEQLRNEDEIAEDSLSPTVREFVEAANLNVKEKKQVNTGYCILDEKSDFGAKCIDLKPNDLEKLKENNKNIQSEEDSLLIFETGTTTEENTCSDSTVKNVTEKAQEEEQKKPQDTIEFDEHCRRLQSKVEFGNAKDSIDIRKSRRKSKSESPPKPDLIQEEKPITLQLTPTVRPVNLLYKKEEIEKERDLNQKLVQEMVMNKMKAQNKTLERKKRNRTFSPGSSPYDLSKSATTDLTSQINRANATRNSTFSPTPDVLLSASKIPLQKSLTTAEVNATTAEVVQKEIRPIRPLSVFSSYIDKTPGKFAVKEEEFKTPVAPPRLKQEEAKKTAEKLRQNARERVRLLSNEELGLSPEDKLEKLKNKLHRKDIDVHVQDSIESLVINTERRNSLLYNNDTLKKKRFGSFRRSASGEEKDARTNEFTFRTKSVTELARDDFVKRDEGDAKLQACKSDPNLLLKPKTPKKKSKDRERRKSITKIFSTLFAKKSGGTGGASRGFLARISPKAKDKSKSCINLDLRDAEEFPKTRRKSFSEPTTFTNGRSLTPPPVPPLPSNYPRSFLRDDSSDDWRRQSSCDTLDGAVPDSSLSSLSGRRSSGKGRKALRQTQLKRHRTAQEIQRKLEETEVKTRELEQRGVLVERALRGERVDGCSGKDESELMQEWFDLMRDRTELRRYERELMVRAQELELEDRHARLQQELRERLEKNEGKSEESLKVESCIINEMMEIVAKRDSLIALLEEDRIRYSEEDRDFEEQILSKGLKLTSVQKVATKH